MKAIVLNAGTKGMAFASNLMAHGVEVFLCDYRDGMFGLGLLGIKRWKQGELYPDPKTDPFGFVAFVLDLIDDIEPDIVFATNSRELDALYSTKAHRVIRQKCAFPVDAKYEIVRDKKWQAKDLAYLMPKTEVFKRGIYAKPCNETSGRGVTWVPPAEHGPLIVQEQAPGVGVGYEALAHNGVLVSEFMHKRKREFPVTGGSSTSRVSWDHAWIREASRNVIEDWKWTGFIMLEYKWNPIDDRFKLIEVNPRPWGSIQLAIDCGVEFPWAAYQYFVQKIQPANPMWELGVETRIVPLDVLAGFCYLVHPRFARSAGRAQFIDAISLWKKFNWEAFKLRNWFVCLLAAYLAVKAPFKKLLGRS